MSPGTEVWIAIAKSYPKVMVANDFRAAKLLITWLAPEVRQVCDFWIAVNDGPDCYAKLDSQLDHLNKIYGLHKETIQLGYLAAVIEMLEN